MSVEAGDHDDGDEAGGGIFFEFVAEFVAGFAGHDDVEENEVGGFGADAILGGAGAGDDGGVIAAHDEHFAQELGVEAMVVDDEDRLLTTG